MAPLPVAPPTWGAGLLVTDGLVRALCTEAARALKDWFGAANLLSGTVVRPSGF